MQATVKSLFVLLSFAVVVLAQTTTSPCIWTGTDATTKKVYTIDLNAAAKEGGYAISPKDPSKEGGDWDYVLNFCKAVTTKCTQKPGRYKAMQVSQDGESCFYIAGDETTKDVSLVLADEKNIATGGVVLTYSGGEVSDVKRQTKIALSCSTSATTTLAFEMETRDFVSGSTIYNFKGSSKAACAFEGTPGGNNYPLGQLGVGGLLIILAIVGFTIYFIVGLLVCKFGLKKEGKEIIPNIYFWMEVPIIIKDGFLFIRDCFLSITKRNKYQELSDPK